MRFINTTVCLILVFTFCFSLNVFARSSDEIEVYKMGDNSITVKWTPYDSGGQELDRYSLGYRVYGESNYTYVDIEPFSDSPNYDSENDEFTKKITGLTPGTIYDIKLDVYLASDPTTPISFYTSITTMTKMVVDKTVESISDPYGNDNVGHIDFAFTAPNESVSGSLESIAQTNIQGYKLLVSSSQSEIYSSGQPYKVLYNDTSGEYEIFRVTSSDEPLTYNGTQFTFNSQTKDGKDLLAFSLYKTNQPSDDNFELAKIYYVVIKPIFKTGTPYEDVIVNATAQYETIEDIATLLPLSVNQVENNLIKLEFPKVGTGSMSYDIFKGRLSDDLTKIHTEYDDGSRDYIQYYNKISDPIEDDVYYFKVGVTGGEIDSKVVSTTISLTPNIAPVMENIKIEKVITDKVNNSSDILVSWDKPQIEDTYKDSLLYRFYLNTARKNQVKESDVIYDGTGSIALDEDGKIILNTKKDINNNDILFQGYPVVFERIAEISPNDLIGSDSVYTGSDPIDHYLATGENYYNVVRDEQEVTRIVYRINGSDFLSNPDVPTLSSDPHVIYNSNLEGELATDYKNKIRLNTTYFLKMDSYNTSISQSSDYSLTKSFTTPDDTIDTVPVPNNFEVESIESQQIGLVWDMLNESLYDDTNVTYEIFVSDDGSYEDQDFIKIENPNITTQDGRKHLSIEDNYTLEGGVQKQVEPNKSYLFRIRAKWDTQDDKGNDVSINSGLSKIVPVTTKRETLSDPDVNTPLAPTDFTLTNVSSKNASFQWTEVDENSTYRIVKTTEPINDFAPLSVTGEGVTSEFAQNGDIYTFTESDLSANTLYYFSIRSEVTVNGEDLFSQWITIPVTTVLVEQPTDLALVSRSSDGHSITISWKGKANLNYETAKKAEASTSYQMSESLEGDPNESGSNTFELSLDNLESNTKYLIKVRAKDPETEMFSKYTEPIQVRTEFNQTDYNEEVEEREKSQMITDIGEEWLKSSSEVLKNEDDNFKLWIKAQKASNMIENIPSLNYTIDLSNSLKYKTVYIPIDLINKLKQKNSNLEIKTSTGNIYFKPGVFDAERFSSKLDYSHVKSKMVKFQLTKLKDSETALLVSSHDYIASNMSDISLKLIGYSETAEELNKLIVDKINQIVSSEKNLAQYKSVEEIRQDLDEEIKNEINTLINQKYVAETPITIPNDKNVRFDYNFNIDRSGESSKYVAYIKSQEKSYETQGQIIGTNTIQFNTDLLGKVVIIGKSGPGDINDSWASENIKALTSKYDFSNEIDEGNFRPNDIAKREEVINFIISILSPSGNEFEGLNSIQKAQKLDILKGFSILNLDKPITRQQLANLICKVYYIETDLSAENIFINRNVYLKDKDKVDSQYIDDVYHVLNLDIMNIYSQSNFYPEKQMTRAEVMNCLAKLLDIIR